MVLGPLKDGIVLELAGPVDYSPADVSRVLSALVGRSLETTLKRLLG